MEQQNLFPKECHHGLPLKEVCFDCERENNAANLEWEQPDKEITGSNCSCEVCEYYRTKE